MNDVPITIRIPLELKERMDKRKDETGVPISEMVRRGLEMYLKKEGAKS